MRLANTLGAEGAVSPSALVITTNAATAGLTVEREDDEHDEGDGGPRDPARDGRLSAPLAMRPKKTKRGPVVVRTISTSVPSKRKEPSKKEVRPLAVNFKV